jgi:hypothetical protein
LPCHNKNQQLASPVSNAAISDAFHLPRRPVFMYGCNYGMASMTKKLAHAPSNQQQTSASSKRSNQSRLLRALGPGLITGAADDDPSGIATYSQAGAQFGFSITWTLLLTYPLMAAIQEISARIGRTTGMGLAANLRQHYLYRTRFFGHKFELSGLLHSGFLPGDTCVVRTA